MDNDDWIVLIIEMLLILCLSLTMLLITHFYSEIENMFEWFIGISI